MVSSVAQLMFLRLPGSQRPNLLLSLRSAPPHTPVPPISLCGPFWTRECANLWASHKQSGPHRSGHMVPHPSNINTQPNRDPQSRAAHRQTRPASCPQRASKRQSTALHYARVRRKGFNTGHATVSGCLDPSHTRNRPRKHLPPQTFTPLRRDHAHRRSRQHPESGRRAPRCTSSPRCTVKRPNQNCPS